VRGARWPDLTMPPLLNANAVVLCARSGRFPVVPRGKRPNVGGAPALTVQDFPGLVAAGCAFNVSGAPVPCVVVSVASGLCPTIHHGGAPAVTQALVCATSNGVPTLPVASAGQPAVQGL
jgi:hypothetical protein